MNNETTTTEEKRKVFLRAWESLLCDVPSTCGTTESNIEDDKTETEDFLGYDHCTYGQ